MVKDIRNRHHLFRDVTPEQQLQTLCTRATSLHEIIPANDKRKIYFDIECFNVDRTADAIDKIRTRWPEAILAITSADGMNSKREMKWSRHVVLNLFVENTDDMFFIKRFAQEHEDLGFDPAVYSSNQAFKCPLQKKPDDERIHSIVSGNMEDLFVTCFFDNCSKAEIPTDIPRVLMPSTKVDLIPICKDVKAVSIGLLPDVPDAWCFYTSPVEDTLKLVYHDTDDYRLNHTQRRIVMGWAKMRDATFRTFWDWVSKGRSADHYEKFLTEWVTVPYVRNETMLTLLEGLYGRKLNTADHRMRKFLHVPVDTYVKERDGKLALHREDFDSRPVQYLALPMGFGKTEAILDMIREDHEKDPKFRCLFITCRKTLVADIHGRAKRRCIPMASYLDYSSRAEKRYEMPKQDIVIVQLESLYCVADSEPYDCIIIDEVESAFNNWISLETHGQNYQTNWETFKTHIQNCKRTIMMDAFPSQKTVKFCQMMGLQMNVIGTHQPPPKREMINMRLGTVVLKT